MIEPDNFGLDPLQTLTHVGERDPAPQHGTFWKLWREMLDASSPSLRNTMLDDVDQEEKAASHIFESVRHVRIGCRIADPPEGTPRRAWLIATHGYGVSRPLTEAADRWAEVCARGVSVVCLRLRGFRGSRMDIGPITKDPFGWICHGLPAREFTPNDLLDWVYPQSIADVCNAVRAVRAVDDLPIYLHGESFGGGLAVAAAALLGSTVDRLALALPTMGDWIWRAQHPARAGMGYHIDQYINQHRQSETWIYDALHYCDSVVHARLVQSPTFCKLALRDDVVPAPTAAAVYNAISTPPANKLRFIVPHGHAETGLENARRHALFERALPDYLDPQLDPIEQLDRWTVRMHAGDRPPAETQTTLFADDSPQLPDAALIQRYQQLSRTLDDLPYTSEFDLIAGDVSRDEKHAIWRRLSGLRKAGKLPKLGQAKSTAVKLGDDEMSNLKQIMLDELGTLGARDRLPYTPEFDSIAERFAAMTSTQLSHHDLWRLIARISK